MRSAGLPGGAPRLRIRDAAIADIPALVALVTSAYRGDASRAGWTTEADLLDGQRIDDDGVRVLLDNGDGDRATTVLVAEDLAAPGVPIACCHVMRDEDGSGYFGMFAVRPTGQGSGTGDRLLREAERALTTRFGCDVCAMTVIKQRTELIAWYERRGYVNTKREKPFPYGDARFGLPKRADLVFTVLEKRLSK